MLMFSGICRLLREAMSFSGVRLKVNVGFSEFSLWSGDIEALLGDEGDNNGDGPMGEKTQGECGKRLGSR